MFIGTLLIGVLTIASLIMPLILGAMSFLIQAAIYAQSARYAASMTGLKSIVKQPDYFAAVGKSLAITIITGIISSLVLAAALITYIKLFGGDQEFWWMDQAKLLAALEVAMASPAAGEQIFSFENMNFASLFFAIQLCSMFFITLIALFVVPRASGLDDKYQRSYTLGLILSRVLIALPFCMAMTGILAHVLVFVAQRVLDVVADDVVATALTFYFMELTLFTGMIFSFEALLLRSGREYGEQEVIWAQEAAAEDTTELRALREAWATRG